MILRQLCLLLVALAPTATAQGRKYSFSFLLSFPPPPPFFFIFFFHFILVNPRIRIYWICGSFALLMSLFFLSVLSLSLFLLLSSQIYNLFNKTHGRDCSCLISFKLLILRRTRTRSNTTHAILFIICMCCF